MISFLSAAALSLSVASTVVAAPSSTSQCVGVAYFMTNNPAGNEVITNCIHQNGEVAFIGKVSTGGVGAHGLSDPLEQPDSLFGQGSLQVMDEHLFVVNPGSDTVSMFAINPNDPSKLTLVGKPANTGGQWPTSIAVSEKTGNICVLNGGHVNGVQCFTVHNTGLKVIHDTTRYIGINQTTPGTGPAGGSSATIFSDDGTKLFVSVKGTLGPGGFAEPLTSGYVVTWDVNNDGTLSKHFTKSIAPKGALLPFGITYVRGAKNALVVTDPFIGVTVYDFSHGDNATAHTTKLALPNQNQTCWATWSKMTGTYFLSDFAASIMFEVSIDDKLQPHYVNSWPLTPNSFPIEVNIGTIDGQDYLYNLAPSDQAVNVFKLAKGGKSKWIQEYKFQSAMEAGRVSYDHNNLEGMALYFKKAKGLLPIHL